MTIHTPVFPHCFNLSRASQMKSSRFIKPLIMASIFTTTPLLSQADEIYQECLLEGKVVADKATDGENVVRIDFYTAKPYRPEARCIIDGRLEFTQPKGSLIENLSEGSVVQYHYLRTKTNKISWQLVGAFI